MRIPARRRPDRLYYGDLRAPAAVDPGASPFGRLAPYLDRAGHLAARAARTGRRGAAAIGARVATAAGSRSDERAFALLALSALLALVASLAAVTGTGVTLGGATTGVTVVEVPADDAADRTRIPTGVAPIDDPADPGVAASSAAAVVPIGIGTASPAGGILLGIVALGVLGIALVGRSRLAAPPAETLPFGTGAALVLVVAAIAARELLVLASAGIAAAVLWAVYTTVEPAPPRRPRIVEPDAEAR